MWVCILSLMIESGVAWVRAMQSGQVVLVDASIIIEAVRTNCWTAITAPPQGKKS